MNIFFLIFPIVFSNNSNTSIIRRGYLNLSYSRQEQIKPIEMITVFLDHLNVDEKQISQKTLPYEEISIFVKSKGNTTDLIALIDFCSVQTTIGNKNYKNTVYLEHTVFIKNDLSLIYDELFTILTDELRKKIVNIFKLRDMSVENGEKINKALEMKSFGDRNLIQCFEPVFNSIKQQLDQEKSSEFENMQNFISQEQIEEILLEKNTGEINHLVKQERSFTKCLDLLTIIHHVLNYDFTELKIVSNVSDFKSIESFNATVIYGEWSLGVDDLQECYLKDIPEQEKVGKLLFYDGQKIILIIQENEIKPSCEIELSDKK